MIEHDPFCLGELYRVTVAASGGRRTYTQMAYHDIVQSHVIDITGKNSPGNGDARGRGALACDGDIRVHDRYITSNHSADIKHNHPRSFFSTGGLQTAWAAGVEIGHLDNTPAATPDRDRAKTLRTRKRWKRLLRKCGKTGGKAQGQ